MSINVSSVMMMMVLIIICPGEFRATSLNPYKTCQEKSLKVVGKWWAVREPRVRPLYPARAASSPGFPYLRTTVRSTAGHPPQRYPRRKEAPLPWPGALIEQLQGGEEVRRAGGGRGRPSQS